MNKITKVFIFSTVFLIPAYLLRFSIFGIPTNVLEILIYLTFISFVFEKPTINWHEFYNDYKFYILSTALIFVGLVLSTLINKNYAIGFGIIKGWFFGPILFAFILINSAKNKRDIENILKTFYFSAFVTSLVALGYFFYDYLTFDGRLQSFYNSPNALAMFLSPSIFIGLYLLKIRNSKLEIQNLIMAAALFIIAFVIYLTHSYATWISIILSFLIASIITKKLNIKITLTSFVIIIIAFLTQTNNPKLNNVLSERSSSQSRIMIWKSAGKILKDNIIFGIGPGNFQNKYLEYQKYFPPYLEWAVPQPHNLYFAFWLQSGIIGLIGFIGLLIFVIKNILANQKNSTVLAVFLGIILYILIHGFFETTYWKNDLSFYFWTIIALQALQRI